MNDPPGRARLDRTAHGLAWLAAAYATWLTALHLHGAVPRHRPESAWLAAAALAVVVGVLGRGRQPGATATPSSRAVPLILWAALVCAALASYAGIIGTGLLSDDFVLLDRAGAGRLTMGNEFFRPLAFLVWRAAASAGDAAAPLLHATSILVHAVNVGLVLSVAGAFALPRASQVVAAAVFAVHPVGVEPVTWISAFPDVLAATGTLLAVLGSLRGSSVLAGIGVAVAVLAKESGVAAPAIALAACWAMSRPLRIPAVALGAVAIFVVARLALLPLPPGYLAPPSRYLVKELVTRTIGTLAAPWSSGEVAAFGWVLTVATCSACGLWMLAASGSSVGVHLRRMSAGLVWAVLSVAPVYSYLFISQHMEGSRYLYLAAAGWALFVASIASPDFARGGTRKAAALACIVAVLAGSLLAVQERQRAWRDAAGLRDLVLAGVAGTLRDSRCPTISVTDLPDQVRGAFVFRNGFVEAVSRTMPGVRVESSGADCTFRWTPAGLVPR